ncbi:MAG: DUF4345 family protein [Pseudomonadota bacterium]
MEIVNIILAVLSIAFGGICLVAPRYALGALSLRTDGANDGLSEIRGASGGAFVFLAAVALVVSHPAAWVMMGVHYAGAAFGRGVSIVLDAAGSPKMWIYFGIEVVFAAWLIGANLGGAF